MTSKLLRTIVGVGIALGGAAPACLGRTDVDGEASRAEQADDEPSAVPEPREPDADPPDAPPSDAGGPDRVEPTDSGFQPPDTPPNADAGAPDAASDAASDAGRDAASDAAFDASIDAGGDAGDPFCDVAWPPTKGVPDPRRAPCVDPLKECTGVVPPRGCFRLIEPGVCSYDRTWEGPLYCFDHEWRCPPGTEDGPRCVCFGPLPPGQTCTDAGAS